MNFFDIILFILKYTPFWAIPIGLMSAHFGYLYWLKDYRDVAWVWGFILLFCLTMTVMYFVLGGPDQIGIMLTHILQ